MLNNRNIAISVLLIFKHYTQTKIFFFREIAQQLHQNMCFHGKIAAKLKIPFPIDFIYD